MPKYLNILFSALAIIIIIIAQLAFINGLPLYLSNLNIVLIIIVLFISLGSLEKTLWWAIGLGFLLDFLSFEPFGLYLSSLFLTVLFMRLLLNNFITNRSLYSILTLTFFGTLFFEFCVYAISFSARFFSRQDFILEFTVGFWQQEAANIFVNLAAMVIIFYLVNFLSRSFRPVFLIKRK